MVVVDLNEGAFVIALLLTKKITIKAFKTWPEAMSIKKSFLIKNINID